MKPLRFIVSLALALVLLAPVRADDDQKKVQKKKGTPGLVEKVDTDGKTLTIKTGKKKDPNATSVTVALTESTRYLIRDADNPKGKDAKLADVAAGKQVMVQLEEKDGKKIATSVMVNQGKKKKDK